MSATTTVGIRGGTHVVIEIADGFAVIATLTLTPFGAERMAEQLTQLATHVRMMQADALAATQKERG